MERGTLVSLFLWGDDNEIKTLESKILTLNNKKDKNYIENKINSIKEALNNSLNDTECYSDVFNELVDRIFVFKENNKKIKLDIYIKTGESLYTTSDNLGKKFHSLDYVTPYCLINDTLTITRGIATKYTKKYDVEFEYNVFINI